MEVKNENQVYVEKPKRSFAGRLTAIFVFASLALLVLISYSIFTITKDFRFVIRIASSAATGIVFAAATFYVFADRAVGPIRELTTFTENASLRRLSSRIEISTGDEIEKLARGINTMMGRLDSSMKRIQRMSFVDNVTQLPNRERFKQETDEAIKHSQTAKQPGAVISINVDKYLRVQNTLGQVIGEELLSLVSERLAAAVRASDRIVRLQGCASRPALLARNHGAEFAILLPDLNDAAEAGRFAQLVAAALRQPFELERHRIVLGVSCGIAVFPQDGENSEEVVRSAELAMSYARNSGGGRTVFFTKKLNQRALSKLVLENEIRQGIEAGQFIPYFQPKVDLHTGRIAGCEALVRWLHPKYGIVSPGKFVPAAEESGLIGPLGDLVMREAAKAAAEWLRRGIAVRVAVNVSPHQFSDDNFTHKVNLILRESSLPPSLFELEITESIAMSNPERVQRLLEPLRQRGIKIAIDDFGTGHSNLASLTSLPFDVFKIDQSFIHALGKDPHAPSLIETIIAMAGGLNYETVAEGVETEAQASFLKLRGATLGQGYLFSAPMPAAKFEEFCRNWDKNSSLPWKTENGAGEEPLAPAVEQSA